MRNGGGWFGTIFVLVFIFGGSIFPPLANWLSQLTGLPISVGMLYVATVIAGIVLPPLFGWFGEQLGQAQGRGSASLPQQAPMQLDLPRPGQPLRLPPDATSREFARMLERAKRPPKLDQVGNAPRFEPALSRWVLSLLIIGVPTIGVLVFLISGILLYG